MPVFGWRRFLTALAALALCFGAMSADLAAAGDGTSTDFRGMALKGYDPVAYFTTGEAVQGQAEFELHWHGATWRFANEENMARFAREPEEFAPAFGGYCALGVAEGALIPGDPKAWDVIGDRLYLTESAEAQHEWRRDPNRYISEARRNWRSLRP